MLSLLLVSTNKEKRETNAITICQTLQIDPFDMTIIETEGSIGIEDVRTIQKKIFFKPRKSTDKAAIIHDIDTATFEAQNALLKVLEEPPAHTQIIVTAASCQLLLPTILSRCKKILLDTEDQVPELENLRLLQQTLITLISSPVGTKLRFAQDLATDKEKTRTWIRDMLQATREIVLTKAKKKEVTSNAIICLQLLQNAYTTIQTTNTNVRLTLEILLMKLPNLTEQ